MTPAEFIAAIAPAAQASAPKTGIPASFTVAQAALESGWGTSKTAIHARNLFNIKADRSWHGPTWQMASTEVENGKKVLEPAVWRSYSNWKACFDDRVDFFRNNSRYDHCWAETTGEGWARAVQLAGYATDPSYADKLCSVIRSHNLAELDKA